MKGILVTFGIALVACGIATYFVIRHFEKNRKQTDTPKPATTTV